MSIKVFKDSSANSIFIEDANGAQFLNSLQASVTVDKIVITDLAKQIEIVSNEDHTAFINENDNPYTGTAQDVCNELNAIFQTAGTPTQEVPVITSSLIINSVQGSILNYELTASYGVGYEWDLSSVNSITTVEGNVRKLIGGASLAVGTYNIPVKAISHNTNIDNANTYKGILYRSNFNKFYTDITPAWDCKDFKTKIERYEK